MGSKAKVTKARREVEAERGANRVVIAFIHPGETSAYFTTSLIGSLLYDRATSRRIVNIHNEWSSANVSASRNSLTAKFLEDEAEWLWWIDADMGWEPDALDRLLEVADPDTHPIVGGLCFGASGDALFPTIYQWAEIDGQLTTVRIRDYERDAVVQCAATGAAFVLIHRRVVEAMHEREFSKAFPWFQETELGGQPVGEDLTFFIRAGLLKFPVHVHTGVKVGHHKSSLLTEALFDAQREAT